MNFPEFMSGAQLTRHGGPEALVWNDKIPVKPPKPDEVLVRVKAAGVNNTDINTRIGWYSREITDSTDNVDTDQQIEAGGWAGGLPFPLIQGADLCGVVVAIGEDVSRFEIGQRITCPTNQPVTSDDNPLKLVVIGSEYDGAFAQYCTLPEEQVFDVDNSPLSDIEIAAIPCAFGTALNLLARAGISENDNVLITGASGGVGLAAVQLATLRGAKVAGIASAAKHNAVLEAGADKVINRGGAIDPQCYDAVIDVVGGSDWAMFIEALRPGGRYAVSGAIAGPIVEADLRTIYLNDITLYGCTYQPVKVFEELVNMINQGKIRPLVSKTYPLKEIAKAQEDFVSKAYPGKLVLIPPE